MGLQAILWAFLTGALPLQRVLDTSHPWALYPERWIQVGPMRQVHGYFAWLMLAFVGGWVVSSLAPLFSRAATVSLRREGLCVRYRSGWPRERVIPLSQVVSAAATGDQLAVRLDSGAELTVASPHAKALAAKIAKRRRAAPQIVGGLGWDVMPGGRFARLVYALGGIAPLVMHAKAWGAETAQGSWAAPALALAVTSVWLLIGVAAGSRRQVTVGADGVRIDHFGRSRFVRHADIASVTGRGGKLKLVLKNGKRLTLGVENTVAIADRIEEAKRRHDEAQPSELSDEHAKLLARGDRSADRWKSDLDKALHEQAYRKETVRPADLLRVVSDPSAHPEQRVAAAFAVRSDGEARSRIRIAADACADRDTQAALEATLEEELSEAHLARAARRHREK